MFKRLFPSPQDLPSTFLWEVKEHFLVVAGTEAEMVSVTVVEEEEHRTFVVEVPV
jgi:hypothetical protein